MSLVSSNYSEEIQEERQVRRHTRVGTHRIQDKASVTEPMYSEWLSLDKGLRE